MGKLEKVEFIIPTPKQITAYLDTVMVGQESAKRKVSIEVYKHLLRLKNIKALEKSGEEINKSNILLTGLTGTGKTFLAQCLAHFLGVPFYIQDTTKLTEAGYVGEDVENCVKGLLQNANYNISLAEQGIIVLDEFDKIGRKGENVSTTVDVGHGGVQEGLLKMIEGTIVTIPEGRRRNPEEQGIQVDTSNILFIAIGSFEGVEKFVEERLNKKEGGSSIGFGAIVRSKSEKRELKELRRNIIRADLEKFGIMSEILGRFQVLCNYDPLDKEDLIRILKLDKSVFTELKTVFKLMDKRLIVKEEIFEYIADKAIEEKTGARGLKSIVEDIMSEMLFNAPSSKKKNYTLDLKLIEELEEKVG